MRKIAIVGGVIARYPYAGMSWHYLNYILGLRAIGYDTYYVENLDHANAFYFRNGSMETGLPYLRDLMDQFDLSKKWTMLQSDGLRQGIQYSDWKRIVAKAEVFINVSGVNTLRGGLEKIPLRYYVDTDPGFIQIKISNGDRELEEEVKRHTHFFTFGETLSLAENGIKTLGIRWNATRQPVFLKVWQQKEVPRSAKKFTTVMSWRSYKLLKHGGKVYGQKNMEFKKFWDLPKISKGNFEIGLEIKSSAADLRAGKTLRRNGWNIIDASVPTRDSQSYISYIRNSKAEFTVVKNLYKRLRNGWTSERSACYLATGRPVVMQETGISRVFGTGEGLLTFDTKEGAIEAIEKVNRDYSRHSGAARKIAVMHYDSKVVLTKMLR